MTHIGREVLEKFEIRKNKKEKEAFRAWLVERLTEADARTALEMPEEREEGETEER